MKDTIIALASGTGRAGLAVVRCSGPGARSLIEAMAGKLPLPRKASLRVLRHPENGDQLDQGLVLWFPGPASFTGEDVAEFHLHGGRAVVHAVLAAALGMPGVRMALPGEFSRRAFLNNRMDLTAAEGLVDLIESETEAQRRQALRVSNGALHQVFQDWRGSLLGLLARMDALIDFPDEDLPPEIGARVWQDCQELAAQMAQVGSTYARARQVRDGVRVALIGAPNVGKSSLLNALAQREIAIVSEIAGTTRDVLEVRLDLGGTLVLLSDTAGLRESLDAIEQMGVQRARDAAEQADLRLHVSAPGIDAHQSMAGDIGQADWKLWNKADQASPNPQTGWHWIGSAQQPGDVERLVDLLSAHVAQWAPNEGVVVTRARHVAGLERAAAELRAIAPNWASHPELAGERLRFAAHALEEVLGLIGVEDVLDTLFGSFCIGK